MTFKCGVKLFVGVFADTAVRIIQKHAESRLRKLLLFAVYVHGAENHVGIREGGKRFVRRSRAFALQRENALFFFA